MKMSKFRCAFVVLTIATIVWGIMFYITLQQYHAYVEWSTPGVLLEPYWSWNGGGYVAFAGALLLCAWMILIGYSLLSRKRRYVIAMCGLLALVVLSLSTSSTVSATELEEKYGPTIKIGLLICCDWEYRGLFDKHLRSTHYSLREMNSRYAETFGIEFLFDWYTEWVEWDSYESGYYTPWGLLEHAIEETGFESGMIYNGIRRDMLLALTGKDFYGVGWRNPDWNACIFQYYEFEGHIDEIAQHELCIFVPDCPEEWCVMSSDALSHYDPSDQWCTDCFQEVNSKKFRFTVVGDVNGDYRVDMRDLAHVASRFGSVRGDENWASSCDINGDDVIDIYDLSAIGKHYGESRY